MRTLKTHKSGVTWNRQRRIACLLIVAASLLAPLAAGVSAAQAKDQAPSAAVPESLLQSATASPKGVFDVLVQGDGSERSDKLADRIATLSPRARTGKRSASNSRRSSRVSNPSRSLSRARTSSSSRSRGASSRSSRTPTSPPRAG